MTIEKAKQLVAATLGNTVEQLRCINVYSDSIVFANDSHSVIAVSWDDWNTRVEVLA